MNTTSYAERIRQKLTTAFTPTLLEIKDDSASHAGHAGHNPLGETHFTVTIVTDAFEKKGLVARHREIYHILSDELKERVHALSLNCMTTAEHTNK